MPVQTPEWVDREEYPFQPQTLHVSAGQMAYLDVGQGPPVVMVHGTPEWSFSYRYLIKGLSDKYRCIAPDHIGFGLSDKPSDWTYLPADHARNLAQLIDHLGLKDITLIVHDFGGPIGLAYALDHPENVRNIVIMNSWLWATKDDPHFARAGRMLSDRLGRFLYTRLNFSVRVMMRLAVGDRSKLTKAVYQHHLNPLKSPEDRRGTWILARELVGSSSWYQSLWEKRDQIRNIPMLILWGLRDSAFRPSDLDHWRQAFPDAQVITFSDTGHFVMEEQGDQLVPIVEEYIGASDRSVSVSPSTDPAQENTTE